MKNYIISGIIAISVSLGVVWLAPKFLPGHKILQIEHINSIPTQGAVYTVNDKSEIVPLDFTKVADEVMDAVVHIKSSQTTSITKSMQQYRQLPDPFRRFFHDDFYGEFFKPRHQNKGQTKPGKPKMNIGSGSGVIINSEGYIVTNNHVIANAEDIEVTLHDNKSYKATVIGTDPSTDLALIQIKEKNLPTLPLVNSDDVKVGEWVVAVGNPFNLNSTVTAGIVSAKSRNINILTDKYAVESFIQTDAAINPGNSGGALVNLQGGLIGINTAIASPTGSYTGYGFAVPSNIVNKVVEDLLKYGTVQRGYLGVTIRGVDSNLARKEELKFNKGIYVESLVENSAAADAGLEAGDVILEIDGIEVNTAPQLQEIVARKRPGDNIILKVARGDKRFDAKTQLKNRSGDTKFLANNRIEVFNVLGAEFEDLNKRIAKQLNIDGGVKVKKLYPGKLSKNTAMKEGFIITKVDKKRVLNTNDLEQALNKKEGGVLFEGIYEDIPGKRYYAFGID